MTLLGRYRDGEFREVWTHLSELGPKVFEDEFKQDADAVAQETMRRVRGNAELLVAHLTRLGYTFSRPHEAEWETLDTERWGTVQICDQVLSPPGAPNEIKLADEVFGMLPLSLRSFYQFVGGVDLMGSYPGISTLVDIEGDRKTLKTILSEPLQVYPLGMALYLKAKTREFFKKTRQGHSMLPIALDKFYRHGFSGGGNEGLEIPQRPAADAVFTGDGLLFVDSLRLTFDWCGFPGFRYIEDPFPRELEALKEKLVSF